MKRFALVAIVTVCAFAGCKQGKGDRCQVEADCSDGLVCNIATNTCQDTSGTGIDATVPDAPRDAAVDMAADTPSD